MQSVAWLAIGTALLCSIRAEAEPDYLPAAELGAAGLAKYWQISLALPAGEALTDAYLVDDHVYLGTEGGYCYAVHVDTGAIRWMQQYTRSGYRLRRPCHAGDRTLLATQTDLQMYDRRTGEPLRRVELGFPCGSPPVSDGTNVYLGGLNGRFYSILLATGFVDWKFYTGGPITNAAALGEDVVYFADDGGTLFAAKTKDKSRGYAVRTFGLISGNLFVNDAGVFVPSRDQTLYLFDLVVGGIRWRARFSGPLYEPPLVGENVLFQYCPDDGVVAVETEVDNVEERLRWALPRGRAALTWDREFVYIYTQDDTIIAADLRTGAVKHTVPVGDMRMPVPGRRPGVILLAGSDGRLFCARSKDAGYPSAADVRKALAAPPQAAANQPATQPATQPTTQAADDPLSSERRGTPLGGRSKISREWTEGAQPR